MDFKAALKKRMLEEATGSAEDSLKAAATSLEKAKEANKKIQDQGTAFMEKFALTPTEISAWPEDLKHKLERGQREVYEYCNSAPRTTTKGLGKTRGKSWTPVWQTQWDKSSKGGKDRGRKGARPAPKGGKGKTPKGKGKGQWPDAWAFKDPKGKAFCRDYHLTGTCPGSCGRSHNCPVRQGGWVCNASPDKHTPDECPHATK